MFGFLLGYASQATNSAQGNLSSVITPFAENTPPQKNVNLNQQ